jgi:hypothetical protein
MLVVKRRVKELRAQGYRRVLVGGHSWGAWVAVLAAQDKTIGIDGLLLGSPNIYGPRVGTSGPHVGKINPNFEKNLTEFRGLIDGITVPTVLMAFRDDPYEPEERAAYAKVQLDKNKTPNLVLDHPKGFIGHSASWLPVFDFAFGKCIRGFLDNPTTAPCPLPPLSNHDFRSVVQLSQVPPTGETIQNARPLVGKKYAAFTLGDSLRHYEYSSAAQRINMNALQKSRESFEFRDGLHCVGAICSLLVHWSDGEMLEFDPKTRNLRAWWIERE